MVGCASVMEILTQSFLQMLEFCQNVNPTLDNYEADGVRFTSLLEPFMFC